MGGPLVPELSEISAGCPVCGGGNCKAFPDIQHLASYPFIPGGIDPMADKQWITAPHRIVDHTLGRVMYGTGDQVPIADAVKYGLLPPSALAHGDTAPEPIQAKRGRRTRHHPAPAENR